MRREEVLVDGRVEKARVGVPVHEGVDLNLRLIERVPGGLHHVVVNRLADPRIQADLKENDCR